VNVGCGWDKRDGYLNVDLHDFHTPDLVADVRDLSMLPTGEYDEVVAQDVLEHLERKDAAIALAEWARVLKFGGQLFVRVPDLMGLLEMMAATEDPVEHAKVVHLLFGTQAYDGDFHLNGFTEPLLRAALFESGFETKSVSGLDGWLFDVVAERVQHPQTVDPTDLVRPNIRRPQHGEKSSSDEEQRARRRTTWNDGPSNSVAPLLPHLSLHPGEVDKTSRFPFGGIPHQVFGRLMLRHSNAINARFDDYQRLVSEELRTIRLRLEVIERSIDGDAGSNAATGR